MILRKAICMGRELFRKVGSKALLAPVKIEMRESVIACYTGSIAVNTDGDHIIGGFAHGRWRVKSALRERQRRVTPDNQEYVAMSPAYDRFNVRHHSRTNLLKYCYFKGLFPECFGFKNFVSPTEIDVNSIAIFSSSPIMYHAISVSVDADGRSEGNAPCGA